MMLEREKAAEIRYLFFAEHWKLGTIVSQLGVHPDVVKRVLGQMGRSGPGKEPIPSVMEPYKPFVAEVLQSYPRLRATRIYDMLAERGYTGSLRTLRRHVAQVRPAPKGEVFVRIETLPGEQAQVDWGHVGKICVDGWERPLWVFVIVLAYSRLLWAELVLEQGVYSLMRSLVRAASFFGGLTRQWLFDNPKSVVLERRAEVVRYHPALLDLSATLHVQPRLCAVGKPNQKGAVERAIRYLKERFFAARRIDCIQQGNEQLLRFIQEVASERRHPVDPERTVAEVFQQEEKPHLLSLPESMPVTDQVLPVPADKTATVRFDTNRYSVPPDYARKALILAASDTTVRLLDGDTEIARHPRCWGRRQPVEDPRHRAEILQRKQAARDGKSRDRLRVEVPRIVELMQLWADQGRNVGSQVVRTLKLLDLYGARVLSQAVEELLQRGGSDYGALCLLCEKRRTKTVALPLELAAHVKDRDVIPHDLGGYDE
jgi:transposase